MFLILCSCLFAQEKDRPYGDALLELINKASDGDAKSLFELARLHDRGFDTILIDSLKSTALYLKAAEKGYAPAMNYIGFRYYTGEAIMKNTDSALYWIRKAADAGDITAAANLGYLLLESEEFNHDEEEAAKWLSIAAEEGVNEAQLKLIYLKGKELEALPIDSALKLGIKYYTGKAPILGTYIIQRASEAEIPKALAILGDAYSKGYGVPYDYNKAIDYFYKAAEKGDPSAQFIIGELLEIFPDALNDFLTTEDSEMISPSYWFSKAAENGVSDSESAVKVLFSTPI